MSDLGSHSVDCDVTLCSPVEADLRFGGMFCQSVQSTVISQITTRETDSVDESVTLVKLLISFCQITESHLRT